MLVWLILFFPSSVSAQGESQGYVSLGVCAADLNGGLDWVLPGGPVGIGGEVGTGWVFLTAVTGSYHFLARRPRKHDLFATVGYARRGSSEFSSQGVPVGGGATYWPAARLGIRLDASGSCQLRLTTPFPPKHVLRLGTGVCGRAWHFAFAELALRRSSHLREGRLIVSAGCWMQRSA